MKKLLRLRDRRVATVDAHNPLQSFRCGSDDAGDAFRIDTSKSRQGMFGM